jgi:cytochrome P450
LGSPENRHITKAIEDSNQRVSVIVQAPEVTVRRMDKKLFPAAVAGRNMFLKFIKQLVADRMQAKQRTDVFSILLSAKDPETQKQLNSFEIVAESTTMLIAGKYQGCSHDCMPDLTFPTRV